MSTDRWWKSGWIIGFILIIVCAIGAVHDEYKAGHYTQEYIQRVQRAEAKRMQEQPCYNPQGLGCNVWANPILTPEQMGIKP